VPLHLFEKFGIELEYMIVKRDGSVAPIADQIMIAQCGEPVNDCMVGACEVSNELAAHVFELKAPSPTADLLRLEADFVEAVRLTNEILARHDCRLLPGPMHPTMDPRRESTTWAHGSREIYERYDQIFDCHGHGWFNLQSCHINLPFHGDEEFARLHSAILLVLPLLPALTAASPFREGQVTGFLDTRVETYRTNQKRCSLISGDVIPEAVFSEEEYRQKILAPMFAQIRPLDPDGLLQHEWLNSRGAIARFERSAIEIRLLDVQECPHADLALARLIIETIRRLVEEHPRHLRRWALASGTPARKQQLMEVIRDGFNAPLLLPEIREAFALPESARTAGDFWRHALEVVPAEAFTPAQRQTLETITTSGNLATRLLAAKNRTDEPATFPSLISSLADCLAENRLFQPGTASQHAKDSAASRCEVT
jgi:glutamate---cysteine ligase / carboxylate-amine ligase